MIAPVIMLLSRSYTMHKPKPLNPSLTMSLSHTALSKQKSSAAGVLGVHMGWTCTVKHVLGACV